MPPASAAPEEQALVQRLKAREEPALKELMTQYGARVYSLALRMTGSRQDAEEVLQDVFWAVFEKIGGFRGDSKLSRAKPRDRTERASFDSAQDARPELVEGRAKRVEVLPLDEQRPGVLLTR